MTAKGEKIPASVLALLRHRWVPAAGYSAHESVFNSGDLDRQARPSFCYLRAGTEWLPEVHAFSHAEAVALIAEGVFGDAARDRGSDAVINEHAQHALEDFCRTVSEAWATYRERLEEIQRSCMEPWRD